MLIQEDYVDLTTPTGPMRTYRYTPTRPQGHTRRYAGLLLYSEIFQQTEPIRRLAVRFASEGYVVMVPEIYHDNLAPGTVLGYDNAGKDKGNELKKETPLTSFDDGAHAVVAALRADPNCSGRIGTVGFCIGGHLSFRAALMPEILAAACFYGTDLHNGTLGKGEKADTLDRCAEVRGELVMIWGRQDPHIPGEGRMRVYQKLQQSGVLFSWHEVNGEHAFMRDEGNRYNAEVARQAFGIALDLFRRAL